MRTSILLLLSVGCVPGETGIDQTILSGTVTIPPAVVVDGRANDLISAPQGLGVDDGTSLTWRSTIIDGKVGRWPGSFGEEEGDPDYFAFAPVADGTFTFTVTFATTPYEDRTTVARFAPADTGDTGGGTDSGAGDTADTGTSDTGTSDTGTSDTGTSDTGTSDTGTSDTGTSDTGTSDTADTGDTDTGGTVAAQSDTHILEVSILDPATYDPEAGTGVLYTGTTDGSGGNFSFSYDVGAGTTYVLLVRGLSTDDVSGELPYSVLIDGSAPSDSTILVGAYLGADPLVGEDPVGGTTATGWAWDPETATWSGTWQMMYLRSVVANEDPDTEDLFLPVPTVDEALTGVYVRAASLTTLGAGLSAGSLYATTSISVAVEGKDQAVDEPIVLDGVAPKVIGFQIEETFPDETLAEIDLSDYSLVADTLVAQELGMLSGLGYVDIVSGTSVLSPGAEGWNGANDSDAFSFTVPETMYVRMAASWPDTAADVDFGIWYPDPDYGLIDVFSSWGDSYCLTGSDPEVCESVITLEPDTTYYLLALGYLGTDEQPYTIELEWVAP